MEGVVHDVNNGTVAPGTAPSISMLKALVW